MSGERWLERTHPPSEVALLAGLEYCVAAWIDLRSAIESRYGLSGDLNYAGRNYGWQIHYKAGGRTLCDLYPEAGSFTVQVVLGGKERLQAIGGIDLFSPGMRNLITTTPQYHDGQWLGIHLPETAMVEDILMLLAIKRRPRSHKS